MSLAGGSLSFGSAAGGASRFTNTRGRINNAARGVNYPSPFFDVAHTYLPTTVKAMFRWCRYYFLTNPLINSVTVKMAEYPVTDLVVDHEDTEVRHKWEEFLQNTMRIRPRQIECNLDYQAYGNSMTSLGFPFRKYLRCSNCGMHERADKLRPHWLFSNYAFRLTCPKCGVTAEARATDIYYKNAAGINLIRWNCEHVDIKYNDLTGEHTYFYNIPRSVRNDITIGKKDAVEDIPQVFIQAMRMNRGVVFSKDNFFHMKRATLAQADRGWGTPLMMPVLKDTFYLQLMKKSQEAILLEHIVPLRILFPQAGSGSSDPYTTIDLSTWRDHVAEEVARWRVDCVAPDSWVETIDGLERARNIREGDLVKNHQGGYSCVQGAVTRPLREGEQVYRINARGLGAVTTELSESHPVWAARKLNNGNGHKLGTPEMVEVQYLQPGDYVGYPCSREIDVSGAVDLGSYTERASTDSYVYVDHKNPGVPVVYELLEKNSERQRKEVLEEVGCGVAAYKTAQNAYREGRALRRIPRVVPFSEELAWALGVYTAEGSTTPKQVMFALHSEESATLSRLTSVMREVFGASEPTISKKSEFGIQATYSSVLAADFFGTEIPGTSTSKPLSGLVKRAPDKCVRAFLDGYLSGDGCWHEDGVSNKTDCSTSSLQLAEGLRQLLLSLRVPVGLSSVAAEKKYFPKWGKWVDVSTSYKLSVSGANNTRLCDWLSSGKELGEPAPCQIGVFADGWFWYRIRSVEKVEGAEVVAIQTDQESACARVSDGSYHGTFCVWGYATANCNYIPIMPLPLGQQTVGGDGRALMLTPEMQALSDQIIAGMGAPREFVYGGLTYSGSNISMRMLENSFINNILRQKQMINWMVQQIGAYMDWPIPQVRFKPFKMADDIQRKAYLFQLNQAQKISDTTLLADVDLDQASEDELMVKETDKRLEATKKQQLAMAQIQGEAQVVMAKAQAKAQQTSQEAQMQGIAPGEPGSASGLPMGMESPLASSQDMSGGLQPAQGQGSAPPAQQPGMSIEQLAQSLAQQLVQLPPEQQQMALENLRAQSPELAQMVEQLANQLQQQQPQQGVPGMGAAGMAASQVDVRPLPEQLPPRRMAASV